MLKVTRYCLAQPLRQLRKSLVRIVGGTILLVGIAMLILPGPAILVIPAGLGILAVEFAWARAVLKRTRALWPTSGTKAPPASPPAP